MNPDEEQWNEPTHEQSREEQEEHWEKEQHYSRRTR